MDIRRFDQELLLKLLYNETIVAKRVAIMELLSRACTEYLIDCSRLSSEERELVSCITGMGNFGFVDIKFSS